MIFLTVNSPYVLVNNAGEKLITSKEATEAIDAALDEGSLVLDWRGSRPKFTGPLDTVDLEPREAELLDYLLTNCGYISSRQIQQTLWPDSNNASIVKRYINCAQNFGLVFK